MGWECALESRFPLSLSNVGGSRSEKTGVCGYWSGGRGGGGGGGSGGNVEGGSGGEGPGTEHSLCKILPHATAPWSEVTGGRGGGGGGG